MKMKIDLMLFILFFVVVFGTKIRTSKSYRPASDYRMKIDFLGSCSEFKKRNTFNINNFKSGNCLPILSEEGNPDANDLYAQIHLIKRNKNRCTIYVDQVFKRVNYGEKQQTKPGRKQIEKENDGFKYVEVEGSFLLSFVPSRPFRATVQQRRSQYEDDYLFVKKRSLLFDLSDVEFDSEDDDDDLKPTSPPTEKPKPVETAPPTEKPIEKLQTVTYHRRPSCQTTPVVCQAEADVLVSGCTNTTVELERGYVMNKDRIYIALPGDEVRSCFTDGFNTRTCCSYVAPQPGLCPNSAPEETFKLKLPQQTRKIYQIKAKHNK